MEHRRKRRSKRIAIWATLFLLPPLGLIGWNQATHNFGVLQPGRIYRSGQMPAGALSRTLRDYQIRTVLNLRGPNPGESWYRDETRRHPRRRCHAGRSSLVVLRLDVANPVANSDPVAGHLRLPADHALRLGIGANRPGLGHRRALAAGPARWRMRAISSRCGTCTSGWETAESWPSSSTSTRSGCDGTGRIIHPRCFAAWAAEGYVPGSPNREEWPYDPAPLVVVTRPRPPLPRAWPTEKSRASLRQSRTR